MIIDTHCHCYMGSLPERIDEVIANMKQRNISTAVQIGCTIETSKKAIELAEKFPEVFYATVGFHPEEAQDVDFEEKILQEFENLIKNHREKIVAIGECGFDFHYLDGTDGGKKPMDWENVSEKAKKQIANQKKWWLAQWELAQKYNLPLVIHTRDAREETLDFMQKNNINRTVMHCFSEDPEFAQTLLDFSDKIYFSFSGILTYKSAKNVQETAKMLPREKILVETDAPFLAPQVVRGTENEPANTLFTFEKLAELREENPDEFEKQVYENSRKFYRI